MIMKVFKLCSFDFVVCIDGKVEHYMVGVMRERYTSEMFKT